MVVGNHVAEVFDAVNRVGGLAEGAPSDDAGGKRQPAQPLYRSGVRHFTPLLGVMAASGILKGFTALSTACGWLLETAAPSKCCSPPAIRCSTSSRSCSATPPGKIRRQPLRHHGDRRRVDASVDDGGVRSGAAAGAVREYFFGIPLTFINYSSSVILIIFAARVSCRPSRCLTG